MVDRSLDSFSTRSELVVGGQRFSYFSLNKLGAKLSTDLGQLPYSLKILLENLLRNEDGNSVKKADIQAVAAWLNDKGTAGYASTSFEATMEAPKRLPRPRKLMFSKPKRTR